MSESKTAHQIESEEARESGDPTRIRDLYHHYGEELASSFDGREEDVTQHGSPEVARWQARRLSRLADTGPVLDVGCGPVPEVSLGLAAAGRRVVCTDLSYGLCRIAREVARRRGSEISVVVADAEDLPFRDETFALVISDDVIEHVPDPAAMVDECARVTAANGFASIATPNGRALSVWIDRLKDLVRGRVGPPERYFLVPSHLREFTRRQLLDLFSVRYARVGFGAVGWERMSLGKRLASALTLVPPFRGLCRHWVVQATAPIRQRA